MLNELCTQEDRIKKETFRTECASKTASSASPVSHGVVRSGRRLRQSKIVLVCVYAYVIRELPLICFFAFACFMCTLVCLLSLPNSNAIRHPPSALCIYCSHNATARTISPLALSTHRQCRRRRGSEEGEGKKSIHVFTESN